DLLHERHAVEAPALELVDERAEVGHVPHAERAPERREIRRHGDALLEPPRRRDEDLGAAREERLHRLDAQPADLEMGRVLLVGERLLLREEVDGTVLAEQHPEVGLRGHPAPRIVADDHEHALRSSAVERGHDRLREGADDPADADALPGAGQPAAEVPDDGTRRYGGDDGISARHRWWCEPERPRARAGRDPRPRARIPRGGGGTRRTAGAATAPAPGARERSPSPTGRVEGPPPRGRSRSPSPPRGGGRAATPARADSPR